MSKNDKAETKAQAKELKTQARAAAKKKKAKGCGVFMLICIILGTFLYFQIDDTPKTLNSSPSIQTSAAKAELTPDQRVKAIKDLDEWNDIIIERTKILWNELQEMRYEKKFHKMGFAKSGYHEWMYTLNDLSKAWDISAKKLKIQDRIKYDTSITLDYMRSIGFEWMSNAGATKPSSVELIELIEASLSRNGITAQ